MSDEKKPSLVQELTRYAVKEVIEPQSKDMMSTLFKSVVHMFSDAATRSIDRAFYKDDIPRGPRNPNGTYQPRTNYTVYSKKSGQKSRIEDTGSRSSTDINYIWLDTKEAADDVVNTLKEEIENYGKTKVGTLYEALQRHGINITTQFPDFKFGWTDASEIRTYPDRGKWFIDLPRPKNVENI